MSYKVINLNVNNFDRQKIEFLKEKLELKTKSKVIKKALDLLYLLTEKEISIHKL